MNDKPQNDEPGPAATTTSGLRFLTLDQVADELATSQAQAYALVRNGELRAFKLGGRGQWRIGRADLEDYIARCYLDVEEFIKAHPFTDSTAVKEPNAAEESDLPGDSADASEGP